MILLTLLRPALIYVVVIVAGIVGFEAWKWGHDEKVKAEIIVQVDKSAEALSDKALEARADADRPGAWQRLRANSCGNCVSSVQKAGR